MGQVTQRLKTVTQRVSTAINSANRHPHEVQLIAVSKGQPVEIIHEAYQAGQRHFGESYLQEALPKVTVLGKTDITWHFIGPIQSNKTKDIAQNFDWVHSVDRLKIAQRLSNARPQNLPPLKVCIQVNVSNEPSKSGVHLADIEEIATAISTLPNLELCGLMAIPAQTQDIDQQNTHFSTLQSESHRLNQKGFALTTLSMGMSSDLDTAIANGATFLRVGSAIFGARKT